ncbi:MAG: putative Ig domain-containing protein [Methylococcales bacterium]
MKILIKTLVVWVALLMSQSAMAILNNAGALWIYDVPVGIAGVPQVFVSPWGASVMQSYDLNVTAADNYDFTVLGSSHVKSPSLPAWSTTVDAAQIVDATGAVVTNLTAANPTGANYNLYANSVNLLPGRYLLNITTTCATWCTLSFNKPSFTISPTNINTLPPVITSTSLRDGTIGQEYNYFTSTNYGQLTLVTAATKTGHSLNFKVTGLPSGLTYTDNYGFGTWSLGGGGFYTFFRGVPTTVGTSNVTITVTDTVNKLSTSSTLPLTINDAAISFAPTLPDGVFNTPYSATLPAATGGSGGFTYTQTGLPNELTLIGDTISGTPTQTGTYSINITATDSVGFSVVVPVTFKVINPALPVACSGTNAGITAFSAGNIVVNGGISLLDNLSTGNLSASNTSFQDGLVDWNKAGLIIDYNGFVDAKGCTLNSLTVKPAITISTTSLLPGTTGTAYLAPLTVSGGLTPYNTTVSGLPSGLSFDGINIIGTPLVSGVFQVTVSSIDALTFTTTTSLSLTVNALPITFVPVLPNGTVGGVYSTTLAATGGTGTFTYSAANLPAGLVLSGNTISGTPTIAGVANVSLTVTDAAGVVSTQNVKLTINSAPGNYTVSNTGKGSIKTVGVGYLMVGTKKLIWDATTTIVVNKPTGVINIIDSSVKAGMKISWSGMLDKKTNTVLTKTITIN